MGLKPNNIPIKPWFCYGNFSLFNAKLLDVLTVQARKVIFWFSFLMSLISYSIKVLVLIVLSTVSFQMWHLELITGLVILVSSCRYLLLKIWPDFAESSEAANSQVRILIQVNSSFCLITYFLLLDQRARNTMCDL